MGYDVIGDVHGQAGKLQALLRGLGYTPLHGSWRPPPGRQAVFVGDLIDRGPEQVAVVNLVRAMV
ncbi:MAG: metallophosphoesterase, partial [Aquincola tertiaricarbonis]